MAEKKTANKAENEPAIEPEFKAPEYVTVKIPRERKDQEDKVVWVNNDRYIIKRGVAVDVPIAVARVLEHEDKMLEKIYEFEETHAQ